MPDPSARPQLLVLVLILTGSLVAFAGMPLWAALPIIALSGALAAWAPRAAEPAPDVHQLDLMLVLFLACAVAQIVPLPDGLRGWLSPNLARFHSAVLLDYQLAVAQGHVPKTLSLYPAATAFSTGIVAAAVLVFWAGRRLFAHGGTRQVIRAVAWLGLGVSLLGIIQRATAPRLIYGISRPPSGGSPFGPFVNHNHFATWAIMALPLTAGYLLARNVVHTASNDQTQRTASVHRRGFRPKQDVRTMWLMASTIVMLVGLLVAGSRSGLIGLTAAAPFWIWITRHRLTVRRVLWVAGYAAILALAVVSYAQLEALGRRFAQTLEQPAGDWGRLAIWRQTLPVIRDYWLTGTGLGTYSTAMLVYQQSGRTYFFNQAHNHYLQLAAEGGLLLIVPAVAVAVSFVRVARRRLATDDSGHFWIRAGAAAGLFAVACQSLWETGLRMPANAVLLAILAALTVHPSRRLLPHDRGL